MINDQRADQGPPIIRRPFYDHLLILRPESKALRELEAALRALELKLRT